MNEKTAHERLAWVEYRIARRLLEIDSAQERLAYLRDIFGRHARAEYDKFVAILPELMRPIRAEEDKAVDEMAAAAGYPDCRATKDVCRKLYRAGCRLP